MLTTIEEQLRKKETIWYHRAEGEYPRKDKLGKDLDLIEEGVVQLTNTREVLWLGQAGAGLKLPDKQ